MDLKVVTPPAAYPVLPNEQADYQGITESADIARLGTLIAAATEDVLELNGGVAIMPATFELSLPRFASCIELPKPPLLQVVSVKYYDFDGTLQTASTSLYQVVNRSPLASRIELLPDQIWPDTQIRSNAVIIRFTAGYVNRAAVPESIKNQIMSLVAHRYENKEAAAVGGLVATPLGFGAQCWTNGNISYP